MKSALTSSSSGAAARYDLPSLLRERLRAAARRNPRFSLRSFAKQLGIDHSTLSQVLRNRRRLSARALGAVGKRLGLSEEAIRAYAESGKKRPASRRSSEDIRDIRFDLDTFQLLSVWHHCAILELIQVKGFKPDSRWIAHALGIAVEDVNIAIQRLLRLGLLEMSASDRWIDKSGDAEFRSETLTEAACNQMNQDVHELAVEAIKHIPSQHRVHRQMVVAVDSRTLSRFKSLADEFASDVQSLASESKTKDEVYQVEISLFPLTTFRRKTGDKNA